MNVNLTAVAPFIALLMYVLIRDFAAWLRSRPSRTRRPDDGWIDITPKGFRQRLWAWLHRRRDLDVEERGRAKK